MLEKETIVFIKESRGAMRRPAGVRMRWWDIRVTAIGAVVLILLLAGHHPLMGLSPSPGMLTSTQSVTPTSSGPSDVMDPAPVGADCPDCQMVCPLMDVTTPGRFMLVSPALLAHHSLVSIPIISPASVLASTRAHGAPVRLSGCIPEARRRRALLKVYLL